MSIVNVLLYNMLKHLSHTVYIGCQVRAAHQQLYYISGKPVTLWAAWWWIGFGSYIMYLSPLCLSEHGATRGRLTLVHQEFITKTGGGHDGPVAPSAWSGAVPPHLPGVRVAAATPP